MPLPAGTSTVESLVLDQAATSQNGISDLVLACLSLKSLKLNFDQTIIRVSNKELTRIPLHHATTLEELDMRFDNNAMLGFDDDVFGDGMIFLADCYRHLTKLKTLGMGLEHLFEQDAWYSMMGKDIVTSRLPNSLEYLKLYCARIPAKYAENRQVMESGLPGIVALLEGTGPQGRLNKLKVIDAKMALFDDPGLEDISRIKTLARDRGVTFIFRDFNAPPDSDIEMS
ncbi:hypothetical protein FSARC_3022 [Fusarium sarcochroum]|uniref:Uncharacterized protein n=1 Tax=Fusarium sarcochroum TaxID=1208366 RepID=A0A8H4XCB4_9HYPO|nr:hypothetical protein FSARC_3022 [Fusarium sarcochroum]